MKGDCTDLPFEEEEFNFITMGFGLRNIKDREKAISEIHRVLCRGGKFLQLDFGEHNKVSKIFNIIVPFFAKIIGVNSKHYDYLLSSKEEFPRPDNLIKEFENSGLKFVKRVDYLFGTISMQIMEK